MTTSIVAFAAGVWWLQQQAVLPSWPEGEPWLWAALVCVPAVALRPLRWVVLILAAFAAGYAWAAGIAHLRMADRLGAELEGRDLVVAGVVSSLPVIGERSIRFEFDAESASAPGSDVRLPQKLLLSWYRS